MLKQEIQEAIENSLKICELHSQRIEWALKQCSAFFPLDNKAYISLVPEQIAYIDQFVFRFAKLQDSIGNKLFKLILNALDEETENLSFRDILNRLEKLNLIKSRDNWNILREARNELAHEYLTSIDETVDALNKLFKDYDQLIDIYKNCRVFIKNNILHT
jgi:hypothetical protein